MTSPSGGKTGLILIAAIGFGIAAAFMSILYLKSREAAIVESLVGEEQQMVAVVVAKQDLKKGQQISPAQFAVRELPGKFVHSNAVVVDSFNNFVGRYLVEDMSAGNSLLTSFVDEAFPVDFSDLIKKGRRAMTIQVDTDASTAGMMRPGNRIDIYVNVGTRVVGYEKESAADADPLAGGDLQKVAMQLAGKLTGPSGPSDVILPVLQNALVLATGRDAYAEHLDALGQPQRRSTTNYNSITLDVTPEQAALLALAQDKGDLIGILRNRHDSGDAAFTGITPLDLFSNATAMKKAAALKKAAEAAGATIDENGNWVTADGKVINKEDIVVSENGTVTTKGGQLVASNGISVNQNGEYVDAEGNVIPADQLVVNADGSITTKAALMKEAGYTINEDGDYVDAEGNVIAADDVIVNADGTITSKDEIMKAAGYTINEDGDYVDANGNIVKKDDIKVLANGTVMTADGKVVSGPKVTVNKDGFIIAEDGTVMTADGKVLTGVTVNEKGEVVGADGKVLRDANLTVAADGTVRDSSGNIITGVSGSVVPPSLSVPDLSIPGVVALTTGGASKEGVATTGILPVEPVAGGSILEVFKDGADKGEAP
ncbi:MAG: Flp pilus assembly protein CpaB [Gammaproteobacteria bacterium]